MHKLLPICVPPLLHIIPLVEEIADSLVVSPDIPLNHLSISLCQ